MKVDNGAFLWAVLKNKCISFCEAKDVVSGIYSGVAFPGDHYLLVDGHSVRVSPSQLYTEESQAYEQALRINEVSREKLWECQMDMSDYLEEIKYWIEDESEVFYEEKEKDFSRGENVWGVVVSKKGDGRVLDVSGTYLEMRNDKHVIMSNSLNGANPVREVEVDDGRLFRSKLEALQTSIELNSLVYEKIKMSYSLLDRLIRVQRCQLNPIKNEGESYGFYNL